MRDLEIRGAGNLLGGEQSGFILEMGFDMYQRVVEEAVVELKEEEFKELITEQIVGEKQKKAEIVIETDIEAFIPDIYIEHDTERLDIYRRLYQCNSLDDINAMRVELQDRFGEYPEEVEHLFRLVELKIIAAKIGFIKVELSSEVLTLFFPAPDVKEFYEGDNVPFQKITECIHKLKQFQPHLKQDGKQLKLMAKIPVLDKKKFRLEAVKNFLENLNSLSS